MEKQKWKLILMILIKQYGTFAKSKNPVEISSYYKTDHLGKNKLQAEIRMKHHNKTPKMIAT